MPSHESYERGSAESLVYSGRLHGIVAGVCGLIFTPLMQARGMLPGGILFTAAGVAVAYGIGRGIARAVLGGGARLATGIYAPSGDSTAYTPTFSHIEALEIRGDLAAAARAWDEAVAAAPESAVTVVRAADFYLRALKDPQTTLRLYTQARSINSGSDDLKRYVQQKIVDLYLGPLQDDGRALVELRRLIDAFPGTREAEGARLALAGIKARRPTS